MIEYKKIVENAILHFFSFSNVSFKNIGNKTIRVIFSKCWLDVYLNEYQQIEIKVLDPNNDKFSCDIYSVLSNVLPEYRADRSVLNKLSLINTFNWPMGEEKIKVSLENKLKVISMYLMNVINGDFTWVEKKQQFDSDRALISKTLGTVFIDDHPVYLKLLKGDLSWKDDIEKFNI